MAIQKIHARRKHHGFTIVELLIVIVVIGILASVTIVAYTGISNRARQATLVSDLSSDANQLAIDNTNNGIYPATAAVANNGLGLKASPGTNLYYYNNATNNTYCMSGANNGTSYFVTNRNTSPTLGICPIYTQTFTSANCPTSMTLTIDARDNNTYWIQKLSDGKCWMLTNLAYAGGGTNTYGDTVSIAQDPGSGSGTLTAAGYYIPTGANPTVNPSVPSTAVDGGVASPQFGYLYNWCAAMGAQLSTSACASATSPAPNTNVSICPSGWRIPTGNGGEVNALNTAVNGGSTTSDSGLQTTWLGQWGGFWNNGVYSGVGSIGGYWTSTQFSTTSTYNFTLSTSSVNSTTGNSLKSRGFAVRCVAI